MVQICESNISLQIILELFNLNNMQAISSYSKNLPFDQQEWIAPKFSLQNHLWIRHEGHENKRIDHQLKTL